MAGEQPQNLNTAIFNPYGLSLGPIAPRPHGFGERVLDSLESFTPKQLLGLPLTAPTLALAGAVRGASFGLLDPTDELAQGFGDYAPPPMVTSGLELAGEIGGSFVPYIGASSIASKAFEGLSLTSKLLRGATTFGAPEILRQALQGEFNPRGVVRSLATGAAFSLPTRALAVPAVFATELASGGDLINAGTAAGFAALFGPLEGSARKGLVGDGGPTTLPPRVDLSDYVALKKLAEAKRAPRFTTHTMPSFEPTAMGASFGSTFGQTFDVTPPPTPAPTSVPRSEVSRPAFEALSPLTRASLRAEPVTKRQRAALATGQLELDFGPKSQVELIQAAAQTAGSPPPVKMRSIDEVSALTHTHPSASADLVRDVQANGIQTPLEIGVTARGRRILFEGKHRLDAARQAGLTEVPTREVPIGPGLEKLLERETTPQGQALATLAATVDLLSQAGETKLADGLTKAVAVHGPTSQQAKTVQLALAQAKDGYVPAGAPVVNSLGTAAKGVDVADPGPSNPIHQRLMREQIIDKLKSSGDPVAATQAAQLERLWLDVASKRKGGAITFADANAYLKQQDAILGQSAVKFRDDNEAMATLQQELASRASTAEIDAFRRSLPEHYRSRGPVFDARAQLAFADHSRIAARVEAERLPIAEDVREAGLAVGAHGGALHPQGDGWAITINGQDVGPRFKTPTQAQGWVGGLESGATPIANLQALRLLAHPRGITIDFDGSGVQLINNFTGETVTGVSSLNEALALVRRAPRLVDDAPDLTPPALGQVPGPGHIGGVATEQAPAPCQAVTALQTKILQTLGE